MTKNEKALWFLLTIVGCAVIWLWLRSSEKGQDIINQIAETLNLPGLSSPVIDVGDPSNYNTDLDDYSAATMPSVEQNITNNATGCSLCGEKTVEIVYPAPVTIVEPAPIYIPTPVQKKKARATNKFVNTPKRPIYTPSGNFVGYL